MSRDIYTEAYEHFLNSNRKYEYGRPDMTLSNKGGNLHTDSSRTEQDNDHDGRYGVDCSSFVWRGLKNAGYNVGNAPFGTHDLFEGSTVKPYAKQHFDVVPAAEAHKQHGSLQPGDVLLFRDKHGSGQHVGIVKGYDKDGHLQFIGSQVSTGPAEVTVSPDGYWDGKRFEIVGALRAKPEFRVNAPVHGQDSTKVAEQPVIVKPEHRQPKPAPAAHAHPETAPSAHTDGTLRKGAHGRDVSDLQHSLNRLGYGDEKGHALKTDGSYGQHTMAAVEKFQHDRGLPVDGIAGPKTLEAMHRQTAAPPRLDTDTHPDHALYQQARHAVHRLDSEHQRAPDQHSDNLAAALTVAARREGMNRVDHAVLNPDASRTFAVQGDFNSPLKRVAEVETQQAVATPIEKSSEAWQQMMSKQGQAAQGQELQPPLQRPATPTPGM
ncbi:NlpC/P60 family protein [Luteibacter rhizovicinus]|uniref:NlpC/P60 family protein n=1 Tax=Luteibacter rhizovicinus TaxID=242606 RepID=A0A4R3YXE0_9GAMM|nr:XVIPCD domain-containing protein [Luteibacter rhizovicinus]TCV97216.1 NlpC/P60 family protein [Luteibacter rhizovicinus]